MIFGKPEQKPETKAQPGNAAPSSPSASSAALAATTAPATSTTRPAPALSTTRPASTSSSAAGTAAAGAQTQAQAAKLRYVDRPDVTETFADSISALVFDGQTLRIEFAVTRVDEVKPGAAITGRRYPACRVVLPPGAAVDLINRMQQIGAALTQAGVVKPAGRPDAPKSR